MNTQDLNISTTELEQPSSYPNNSMTAVQNDIDTNPSSFFVLNSEGELTLLREDEEELNITITNSGNILPRQLQTQEEETNDDLADLLKAWDLYDKLYLFLKGKISYILDICL